MLKKQPERDREGEVISCGRGGDQLVLSQPESVGRTCHADEMQSDNDYGGG